MEEKTKPDPWKRPDPPKVGQTIEVRGRPCEVVRVHPFGTVDVSDGERHFRISGLSF